MIWMIPNSIRKSVLKLLEQSYSLHVMREIGVNTSSFILWREPKFVWTSKILSWWTKLKSYAFSRW